MIQRGITSITQRWQQSILDLVYPPHCVGCGVSAYHWCPRCHASLNIISNPICSICGKPSHKPKVKCVSCQEYPVVLKSRSYARYQGSLLKAIISLKYRPNQEVARMMGGWLAELCRKENWQTTMIVPVPLSTKREKQRGYNQAELIARGVAREMDLPLRKDILKRTRDTGSQVGLDPSARFVNVQNAFVSDSKIVKDQIVFLVDDLLTTGATMVACSRALLHAGVRKVYGITVARA